MGIVRGTGRQTLGAVIIFVSYYLVALPVGVPLMFATYLGLAGKRSACIQILHDPSFYPGFFIAGIWWGFVLGLGVQDLFLMAFVAKLDWQKEAEKVSN